MRIDPREKGGKGKKPAGRRGISALAVLMAVVVSLGVSGAAGIISPQGELYAAERRVVKVAFFPMDGYHILGADGSYGGMDVEYLDAVSEYAGWEIEYVECDSWEDALAALSEKKVDLVGSAQYSAERAKDYDYADLSSGYTFGVIATNADGTIAYEDFPAMEGITFGMVTGYVRKNEFLQYLSDNGITDPKIKEYGTTAELQQALSDGEIDALVHTFTEIREGQRLIGRFAPRPFYYISYKGNDDVLRELNQAIADLKMNRPELEAELMNEFYYSRFDKAALLTTAEKEFIEETDTLTIGYLDGHYPFSYEEDGEFKGLSREMLETCFSVTGVALEYKMLSDEKAAEEALADGEVDVLAYCMDSSGALGEKRLKSVREYATVPLVLVMNKRQTSGEIGILATVSYLQEGSASEVEAQGAEEVRIFSSQEECMDAVVDGKADAALCDGYMVEHLLRTDLKYENIQIRNIFSSEYPISVVVREDDTLLAAILTKMITDVDYRSINEYMLRENTYPLVSVKSYIQDHSLAIIVFLLFVVVAVILVAKHLVDDGKKIQKLMYKDPTIDIWNLNYLLYWGRDKLLPSRKEEYAVVYLNLPHFRRYNTIYGFATGERLLANIAEMLKESLDEKTEICARNQGERFVLLLSVKERKEFLEWFDALKDHIEKRIFEGTGNRMMLQAGIYFLPPGENDLRTAVARANQALEFTGKQHENAVVVYDKGLEDTLRERHEREKILESVDVEKDFVAYYQPKVDIRSGRIVGAEALVRLMNPAEGGAIKSPGFFVPYYEQTGQITEIDFFVYRSVCKMLRRRLDAGESVVTVSCNFSRLHFIKPHFVEQFKAVLDEYDIPKDLIEVEVTETLIMEDMAQATVMETLDVLHEMGVRLSIDDFGSGYSSLGVFERMPASVIKLDRSFLLNRRDHERQVAIMRGIVKLANEMKAQIVCEGVETEVDIELMREIGANVAQGYYYSRPIPEAEFERRLSAEAG